MGLLSGLRFGGLCEYVEFYFRVITICGILYPTWVW